MENFACMLGCLGFGHRETQAFKGIKQMHSQICILDISLLEQRGI